MSGNTGRDQDDDDEWAGSYLDKLKLKFEPWFSDRDEFTAWMNSVTAVVRSLKHGDELENWLDVKLDRGGFQAMMVSAIITDDPDFALPMSGAQPEASDPDPGTVTRTLFSETPRTVRSVHSLRTANLSAPARTAGSFYNLSVGAQNLDRLLYSIIRGLVKGSKSVLLECTQIQSYAQGMCLLQKHCEIARNDRIKCAFEALDGMKYKANAQEWASTCIKRTRELFASRASMTHYALTRVMHSLDGKLKTVQYKIAEDLNALAPEDEVNIYDLIQTYASMIASVGDSASSVNAVEDDDCHYCHKKGHHENSCHKKKADLAAGKTGDGKGSPKHTDKASMADRWKLKCDFCGRKGHLEDDCRIKEKALKKVNAAMPAPQPANNTQAQAQMTEAQKVTQASLAAYLSQLHKGQAPAQRLIQRTHMSNVTQSAPQPARHPVGRRGERIGEAKKPGPTSYDYESASDPPPNLNQQPVGYDGQRVGEASHFGPSSFLFPQRSQISIWSTLAISVACVLSVCDGMGCGLASLRANDAQFDRYLAVEISADARQIARNLNPDIKDKSRIDHSWHSNLLNITEEDIAKLGHNSIALFLAGPPCQDFSRLRLITKNKAKKATHELRPGLDGPNGRLFREVIQILQWVLKHNPDCEFLIENVDFSDMEHDWAEICGAIGEPMIIDSQMYSFTQRNRAYWSNFVMGRDMPPPVPEMDPNMCLTNGRTFIQHESRGRSSINQIGGTWKGDPSHPYASTARPILVFDPDFLKPQHITPEEAEKLHGMEPQCTAGLGVSNKQRLEAIGRGWDLNVTNLFLSFSKLAQQDQPKHTAAAAVMHMYQNMQPDEMAQCMMMLDHDTRDWCMTLLNEQLSQSDDANSNAELGNDHISQGSEAEFADGNSIIADNRAAGYQESSSNEQAQEAIAAAFMALEPEALAEVLMEMEPDARDWYLSLIASQQTRNSDNSSVLDSGSSRHLQTDVCVTHAEDLTPLAGFNGSTQWTEGNGFVPAYMEDSITGKPFKVDLDNVDLMTEGLVSNILSLGKLLRIGWEFHMSSGGKECYALTPGGAHRVEVNLGMDDILRICHEHREGQERVPLPTQPEQQQGIYNIRKTASDASSKFIHECFFHRGDEKLSRTLGVTKGYKEAKINSGQCDSCAKAKAREFGLSQQRKVQAAYSASDDVFDDDNSLDPDDSEPEDDELEYIAPIIGRELGEQNVPRFDLDKLRPFEAMFIDNKDYPCKVRGGAPSCLVFVDYKTRTKHKIDIKNKAHNGMAFKRIVAREGIHKLPYHCRVYTDGCGSMNHVRDAAVALGIDHQFIPPHQQSLNEAEKVCDSIFAETRAVMEHHNAPDRWFSLMVDYAIYTDIRTATSANRDWKTPFELTRGSMPFIGKIHRPCTRCFVQVPKAKRKELAAKGLHNLRAEPGRLVGFHGPYSSTYAVILDKQHKGQQERLVHSRNVSFNDDDHVIPRKGDPTPSNDHGIGIQARPAVGSEEAHDSASFDAYQEPAPDGSGQSVMQEQNQSFMPMPEEFFDLDDPANETWFTHAAPPESRPRPSYHGMCDAVKEQAVGSMVMSVHEDFEDSNYTECMRVLHTMNPRHETFNKLAYVLAAQTQTDMDWNKALESEDRDLVIQSLEKEMESLLSTILTEIKADDDEYETARSLATPGRIILGTKRSGNYKSRGVKQGFKEDTELADGPNFNYYAHVATFNSIRMSTFRLNRDARRIALKDVSTAFLQSHQYPDGTVKYVSFKDPLTKKWNFYRQSGPLYGEKSATKRWEDTIAPWYEDIGYERGENEPCAFHDDESDALVLLYTDDNFLDAEEGDVDWTCEQLDDRFMCRDAEWLAPGNDLDCLGMQLFQTDSHTGYYLENYILKTLEILGMSQSKKIARTPICKDIDPGSAPLTGERLRLYPTAVGCFGWMSNTCRPDISYAHSRMSQHLSHPTESAWEAVVRCCEYLRGTADLCIAAPRHPVDKSLDEPGSQHDDACGWEFYCDADFAGNSDESNNRRSQNGYIALLNGAPVMWGSKVSSVAFAHPDIEEAHPDISSGAAEVYAAGNATFEFLHLSYTADEMGIPFPQPMTMQVDNKAAIAFADNTAFKSKLKHIDTRQKWVKTLRNKNILQTQHVPSKENLADIFTKILDADTFEYLRDRMMLRRSSI